MIEHADFVVWRGIHDIAQLYYMHSVDRTKEVVTRAGSRLHCSVSKVDFVFDLHAGGLKIDQKPWRPPKIRDLASLFLHLKHISFTLS